MTKPHPTEAMIALYDRFTHVGDLSRRDMVAQMARLAGGTAAANALLGLIAARADAAPLVAADDARIKVGDVRFSVGGGREMAGYLAQPAKGAATASRVLVIHENRGLNDHIRDVARRLAAEGLVALAADFLAPNGGTPTLGDATTSAEDKARTMIGTLDRQQTVADGVATLKWLAASTPGKGVPGAVGFCWGGGMVNALAVAAGPALRAGAAYYGAAPQDVTGATRVKARLMLHYAGLDERINAMGPAWQAALTAAGVRFEAHTYPGVNHAFNNDTSPARYDMAAADLAWQRTVALLKSGASLSAIASYSAGMNARPPESPSSALPPGPAALCTAAKVRRLSRQVSQIYDDALNLHGLTIGQFGLLACLSRRRGLGIGALAERLAADASTVSRLVKPLASDGLLRIEIDPEDRRGRLVWLTDTGHQRRAAAQAGWQAAQDVMEQRLGGGRLAALRFLLDESYERLEIAE